MVCVNTFFRTVLNFGNRFIRLLNITQNNLNLISLLVKRQNDNPSPGAVTGGIWSLALIREVNLDTQSSDTLA